MIQCDNDFKKPFIHYLQEYNRIKFNPDLVFDQKVLDQLGFKPCSECCKNLVEDNEQQPKEATKSIEKKEKEKQSSNSDSKKTKQSETGTATLPSSTKIHGVNPNAKTITESIALYKQYKSVEKVAEVRNLTTGTIYNHLFVSGEIDYKDYIAEDKKAKAFEIWSNKQEGEQIGPKLDEFLDLSEKAAFYYYLRSNQPK